MASKSLVTIYRPTGASCNADYQPLYLASRVVHSGDIRVNANWSGRRDGRIPSQTAAFLKSDGSVATLLQNTEEQPLPVDMVIDGRHRTVHIPGHSDVAVVIPKHNLLL